MHHHFTEATINNPEDREYCPRCGSSRANRNGTRFGKQIYLCRDCGKQWRPGPALGKHRFPPEQIGAAIRMYYSGLPFRRTAESLMDQFDIRDTDVSPQTVRFWVRKYTDAAKRLVREYKAPGGGAWWLCSKLFRLHQRMWWIVVDDATGYILGSHISCSAGENVALDAVIEALGSTALPCETLVHGMVGVDSNDPGAILQLIKDKLPVKTVIREVGSTSAPIPSQTINNVLHECVTATERFARIRIDDELQRYITGWVFNRNLFTSQEELCGRTPGRAAGVVVPFEDWADVVRLEAKAYVPGSDT